MYQNTPLKYYNMFNKAIKENNQRITNLRKKNGNLEYSDFCNIYEQKPLINENYKYTDNVQEKIRELENSLMSGYELIRYLAKDILESEYLVDYTDAKIFKIQKHDINNLAKIKGNKNVYKVNIGHIHVNIRNANVKDGIKILHEYNQIFDKERQRWIKPAQQIQSKINLEKEYNKKINQIENNQALTCQKTK